MAFLDGFFNIIFGFMLNWNPLYSIITVAFIVSLLVVVVYKFLTNQHEMKRLKEELKDHQKKMKEHKHDTEKMMSIQKEAMKVNMQYMTKSMWPTLITFLPILLIFGWLNAHLAFEPLAPDVPFPITVQMEDDLGGNVSIATPQGLQVIGDNTKPITEGAAEFELKGVAGEYLAAITYRNETIDKHIIITTERKYAPVKESYKSEAFKQITLGNKPLKVIFGLGWLWAYIISAIVFSLVLRKIMNVH